MASIVSVAIATMLWAQMAGALVCYENDENGKIYEVSNGAWNYCVFIPGIDDGRVFGVGPEVDWTKPYDQAFGMSDTIYQILSVCLLEKYDFGQLNPKYILNPSASVEFMFRCICNYDRCNSATTFGSYLKALKLDNAFSNAEKH